MGKMWKGVGVVRDKALKPDDGEASHALRGTGTGVPKEWYETRGRPLPFVERLLFSLSFSGFCGIHHSVFYYSSPECFGITFLWIDILCCKTPLKTSFQILLHPSVTAFWVKFTCPHAQPRDESPPKLIPTTGRTKKGDYKVNSLDCYPYRLIGKLPAPRLLSC